MASPSMIRVLAAGAVLTAMFVGCNDILGLDPRPGATSSSGDASFDGAIADGPGTSSGEGGTKPTDDGGAAVNPDGGACEGPFTIQNLDTRDGGILRGRVTLSEIVTPGNETQPVTVAIISGRAQYNAGSLLTKLVRDTTPTNVITFELSGVPPAAYFVQLLVDKDKDQQITEVDLGGFYVAPGAMGVLPTEAREVTVGETPVCLDFKVGPIPCFTAWGNTCEVDGDCRPTLCECPDKSKVIMRVANACNPSTKVCQRADGDCSALTCTGGSPVERAASCIGR